MSWLTDIPFGEVGSSPPREQDDEPLNAAAQFVPPEWELQQADQWCWAACAVMIARKLGVERVSDDLPLTQCAVVALVLDPAMEEPCTKRRYLGDCRLERCATTESGALRGVVSETLEQLLPKGSPVPNSVHGIDNVTAEDIRDMIAKGWPVAVLTQPLGGDTNHYVLITDYDSDSGDFHVWDPAPNVDNERRASLQTWYEIGKWIGAVMLHTPEEVL